MGKKGIYISSYDIENMDGKFASGIHKKILSQYKILSGEFYMDFLVMPCGNNSIFQKIIRRMPFTPAANKWIYDNKIENADFVYIRRSAFDWPFTQFLKKIRKYNKNITILLEIPTYPYDDEFVEGKDRLLLLKEKKSRKHLQKYIDAIVTMSNDEEIFRVKTIVMPNGVEVDSSRPINPKNSTPNIINLICVSTMNIWHGYERLLYGMHEYYNKGGKREIILHMVGDGPEYSLYKNTIEKYNLQDNVTMYGMKYGKELDGIYDKSDIGIVSLGDHRKNIYVSSALKSKEYCAKGLPQISGANIDIFDNSFKYFLKVPADDEPVAMQSIADFYDDIYNTGKSRKDVIDEIRTYAYEHCDMKHTMKPVIDYINGKSNG